MHAAVETTGVTKRFGSTVALRDVHLEIAPGSLHGLAGRNGAGKSTLVAVLTGLLQPDAGEVRFDGAAAPALSDRDGWRARAACVYQHSMIVPHISVAENIFLDRQPVRAFGAIDWQALRTQARELLAEWNLRIELDPDALGETLWVEERQLVEIVRAISFGARFIILDEPTARLEARAIARLFEHLRTLNRAGVTILFISHQLQELYELCDSVSVLRDGRLVRTAKVHAFPHDELIAAMTGESVTMQEVPLPYADIVVGESFRRRLAGTESSRTPVLEIENLAGDDFEPFSLRVMPGEMVGIAGIGGSGKAALAETIAGLRCAQEGVVRVDGRPLRAGVGAALEAGIGFVPRDRHAEGLVPELSIEENVTLTIADRLGKFGWIDRQRRHAEGAAAVAWYGIVARDARQPVAELSGGNQQKVVFARALARDPNVLVAIDPTAGVDVTAKAALYAQLARLAETGKAIVIVSDDLEDLRICRRVLVLLRGRVVAELAAGWNDTEVIARMEGLEVA